MEIPITPKTIIEAIIFNTIFFLNRTVIITIGIEENTPTMTDHKIY